MCKDVCASPSICVDIENRNSSLISVINSVLSPFQDQKVYLCMYEKKIIIIKNQLSMWEIEYIVRLEMREC